MERQFDIRKAYPPEVNTLCMAIIEKAVDDYIETIVKDKNHGKIDSVYVGNIREDISDFFHSDYFQLLISGMGKFENLDADTIINMCNQKGQYYLWRKQQGCPKCKKRKCIHKNVKSFCNKKNCPKEREEYAR